MLFALCLGYASTHFIDVLCLCNHFSPDITPYSVDLSILAIGYQRHHSTQYQGTIHTAQYTRREANICFIIIPLMFYI